MGGLPEKAGVKGPAVRTLDAALAYARRGWRVFPCRPGQKAPATPHGCKDATTEEARIQEMFGDCVAFNVAVATGNGLVVLDVDNKGADGVRAVRDLEAEIGALPETYTTKTPSDGRHLYFTTPNGRPIGNRTGVHPGLDVRGEGGYVVAPPSRTAAGSYEVLNDAPPAALPDAWATLLTGKREPRRDVPPAPAPAAPTAVPAGRQAVPCGYAESALAGEVAALRATPEGRRNDQLNRAAFALGQMVGAGALDRGRVERELLATARDIGLGSRETAATIRSGVKAGMAEPRAIPGPCLPAGRRGRPTPRVEGVDDAPDYRPFPVEALPEPMRGLVAEAAGAVGCDPAFVALPLLAAAAAAIGNARRVELKRGWTEPAILWTCVVGESGTHKSPALELALRPLRDRQRRDLREHERAMEAWEKEQLRYDADLAAWRRSRSRGDPPEKPERPVASRCVCDDVTVEALALILLENPRGLLVARDELAAWFGAFDRYARGRGADAPKWVEMHGGRPVTVDRKTSERRTIYVPRAAVSVAGAIQPGVLQRALGREFYENGLAARLLLAYPPRLVRRWTEAEVSRAAESAVAAMFERLFELAPIADDAGEPSPGIVGLSPGAKAAWVAFYNAHAAERLRMTGDLAAAWSKLEGYAARLALVAHLVRWSAGDTNNPDMLDEQSLEAGVALARWFGQEARRVYAMLAGPPEDGERQDAIGIIRRRGGAVTARDLMRSSGRFQTAADAELALDALSDAGLGRWEDADAGASGGRPTRRFVLTGADTDTTPITAANSR